MVKILLIGSGGREHAISWKLSKSDKVARIYVAPGNAGTSLESKTVNVDLNVKDFSAILKFCEAKEVSLVIVGPEDPLAAGIVDFLTKHGIRCFGPSQKAAQIEADKSFAKDFMQKHNIPTARYQIFDNLKKAQDHIKNCGYKAWVLKASGLAAGKGVLIAQSDNEALAAAKTLLEDKPFGPASDKIVIEELLQGEEVSVLCFTDGDSVAIMPPAQDHKRLLDGDAGPNTGGMGAYCPCSEIINEQELKLTETDVLLKTIQCLKKENIEYKGVLYAGMMLTPTGPKVLEFNCRFGDPETQAILALLKSDLFDIIDACVAGKLKSTPVEWYENTFAAGVVVASAGYPDNAQKGKKVEKIDEHSTFENKCFVKVFHAGTTRVADGSVVTSGGRVLAVVAVSSLSLKLAIDAATQSASKIHFDGAYFRKDIGYRSLSKIKEKKDVSVTNGAASGFTYESAGVSIERADAFVDGIKALCASSSRPGADVEIGGFGGVFDLKASGYKDALLIAGTDGVGTKLKVAQMCNAHDTVGIDLVAMCVNDILAHSAEPLLFLDYYATGRLDVKMATDVVKGVVEGCKQANCALSGGETAEMPGFYEAAEYDIAGFAVGAVERNQLLPRIDTIESGDIILGLSSSGVHSNGFSLVRTIVEKSGFGYLDPCPWLPADKTTKNLGSELITPTKIYVRSVLPVLRSGKVKAVAHITGGGLLDNLPRVFPKHLNAKLDARSWNVPPVFCWLANIGNVSAEEMARTFNCGIGLTLTVAAKDVQDVQQLLQENGEKVYVIGTMVPAVKDEPRVQVMWLNDALAWKDTFTPRRIPLVKEKVRTAVLLSGSGTNLQALMDYTRNRANDSAAEIVLVISNIDKAKGLQRAEAVGIQTRFIDHKSFKTRVEFDMAVNEELRKNKIEVVCLAGFMRILSAEFCELWQGKLLNIHPSLLPSFRGAHAIKDALEAGVRLTGATVHFVVPEVDAGGIICQEAVPIVPGDTEDTLLEKVHKVEHRIFPRALELVARRTAVLRPDNKVTWNVPS